MSDEQAQPDEHARAVAEDYIAGLTDDELSDLLNSVRYPADTPKQRAAKALAGTVRGPRGRRASRDAAAAQLGDHLRNR